MGNLFDGVLIDNGATLNTVGGTTAPARNVISENANGVALDSSYNLIEGNFIGTDAKGVSALGNTNDGVLIHNQASDNVIGGIASGSLNVISGNQSYGVAISDSGTDGNDVEGNDIGTDSTGTKAVPNGASGVYVHSGASLNLITNQNVIDYNAQYGVLTDGGQTLVSGNSIYHERRRRHRIHEPRADSRPGPDNAGDGRRHDDGRGHDHGGPDPGRIGGPVLLEPLGELRVPPISARATRSRIVAVMPRSRRLSPRCRRRAAWSRPPSCTTTTPPRSATGRPYPPHREMPTSSRRIRRRKGPGSAPTAARDMTSSAGPRACPPTPRSPRPGSATWTWTTTSSDPLRPAGPRLEQPRRRRLVLPHHLHRRHQPHRRQAATTWSSTSTTGTARAGPSTVQLSDATTGGRCSSTRVDLLVRQSGAYLDWTAVSGDHP